MEKALSVAALKKAIKTATVKVDVKIERGSDYATARIELSGPGFPENFRLSAQACQHNRDGEDESSHYSRFNFTPSDSVQGIASGWYAIQPVIQDPKLRGYELDAAIAKLETWRNFSKLVADHIQFRNLELAHRNCDLSPILVALRDFGAFVQVTVNGLDRWEWNRKRYEDKQTLLLA